MLLSEKAILTSQLADNRIKLKQLTSILNNTSSEKKKSSGADKLFAVGGVRVAEFRVPKNKIKVNVANILRERLFKKEAEPVHISELPMGRVIERIRHNHAIKHVASVRLEEHRMEENRKLKADEAKKRKEKQFPKVVVPASAFPNRYIRGELPCTIEHGIKGWFLSWACPLENLDYSYYLPVFFDGLQVDENPSSFLARQGIEDLLYAARGHPERIIPNIEGCVRPIRNALSKFQVPTMLAALKAIQQLIRCNDGVGPALMPFSKQFLFPIATFLDMSKNLGDQFDYAQQKNNDVGDEARRTLELLEEFGGPGALAAIKFSVPLYESCMKDSKN